MRRFGATNQSMQRMGASRLAHLQIVDLFGGWLPPLMLAVGHDFDPMKALALLIFLAFVLRAAACATSSTHQRSAPGRSV